jgi:hypothetical protein
MEKESIMSFDAISALREGGAPVDLLSDEQRGVLATLSPEEAEVIVSVNQRFAAIEEETDVEGHINVTGGLYF